MLPWNNNHIVEHADYIISILFESFLLTLFHLLTENASQTLVIPVSLAVVVNTNITSVYWYHFGGNIYNVYGWSSV